jgi:hypothetical protein
MTSDLVLLAIASLILCGCCRTASPTVAVCHSSDALDGLSWEVDPTKDLHAQGCEINPNFPGMILCTNPEMTVECKLP